MAHVNMGSWALDTISVRLDPWFEMHQRHSVYGGCNIRTLKHLLPSSTMSENAPFHFSVFTPFQGDDVEDAVGVLHHPR